MRPISGESGGALQTHKGKIKYLNKFLLYMKKKNTIEYKHNTTENGWTVGLIQDKRNYA